jgi:hypothetical protein
MRTKPTDSAGVPVTSGVPTINVLELCCGWAHEPKASGGPCSRFGDVHAAKAGTSGHRAGVAPLGLG